MVTKLIDYLTHIKDKITTNISDVVASWKDNNQTIVFTNGCFDILHAGHVTYLEKAKALGDRLIIGVNTDTSIKRIKGENKSKHLIENTKQ